MKPLRQGVDALNESIAKAKNAGGDRVQTNWLKWEDAETKFLRFLTDINKIYILAMHDYYLTPSGKRRTFICRKEVDDECEICQKDPDASRRENGWGIAVVRKEVREDGVVVNYVDDVEEKDGKVTPVVGVVRQAPTNFWIYLQALQERRGSLRDYDVEIIRKGDDKGTVYMPYDCTPRVEIPEMDQRYAKYVPDLGAMLERMASEEYYKNWLHGTGDSSDSESSSAHSATRVQERPSEPEMTEFDRLRLERDRLQQEAASSPTYG